MNARFTLPLLLAATLAARLPATLLLSDSFAVGPGDYTTGALATQTGTPETGSYDANWGGQTFTTFGDPAISASGLSYAGIQSSGGSIVMDRSGSGTTLTKNGTVDPSGTPSAAPSGSVYFSGLLRLGGANWASLGLQVGGSGKSLMGIGINNSGFGELRDNGAVIATAGSALSGWSSGDTVLVVGKIQNNGAAPGNDLLALYLNPTLASEPATATVSVGVGTQGWFPGDPLELIEVSADLVGQQPATYFDEIRVGETWADVTPIPEPSAFALFGLAGIAATLVLRRRKA